MPGADDEGVVHPEKARQASSEKGRELLTEREATRPPGRPPSLTYWLIARNENGRIEVLTIDLAEGEQALPVFNFVEEAEMYLGFEASGDGWHIRETRAGELTSVLYGLCAHVGRVALDPLPQQMVTDETVRLLSLDRKSFVRDLLDESELKGVAARGLRTRQRKRAAYSTMLNGIPDAEGVGNELSAATFLSASS